MQITDPALATFDAGLGDACCTLPWRMMIGRVPARARPDALNGFLKRLVPVRLALGALAAIASGSALEFMSREERSSPARALPRSPCRCRLGGNRRGQLIGAKRRERGETRLGATRLAPEAARRLVRVAKAMPEQSVGDNRATQLIGAQRRVNARVRALAALDRETLSAGPAGRLSGKGRAARYPTRKGTRHAMELGSPWARMSTPRRGPPGFFFIRL